MFTDAFEKKAGPVNISLGQNQGNAFAAGMAGANQPSAWQNVKNAFGFGDDSKAPKPPPPPVNVASR